MLFVYKQTAVMLREEYYKTVSYLFTYIVWVNNLNKKKLVHYLNISISRTLFCLPLISCLFTEALSVNELIIREKIQIFLTWTVLSILLVLRMEIMDCVGHDVPWVHGFLQQWCYALHCNWSSSTVDNTFAQINRNWEGVS